MRKPGVIAPGYSALDRQDWIRRGPHNFVENGKETVRKPPEAGQFSPP